MKYIIIAAVAVFGLGGLFLLTQKSDTKQAAPSLSMQIIKNDVTNGGQLIDVRTPEEFSSGHIDGAINLSLQDIQSGKMPNVAKDKLIYVYCHSGNRSSQATVILKNAGYQNINDLGAMTHVQSLGGNVIKS